MAAVSASMQSASRAVGRPSVPAFAGARASAPRSTGAALATSSRPRSAGFGSVARSRVAAQPAARPTRARAAPALPSTIAPPLVGSPAPDFSATAVLDSEFVDVSLSQYRGKYVVLFFYPLDFTFVCPTEITAFSDAYDKFAEIGAEVLGVSVDSQFSHLAWTQTERREGGVGDLRYPLVSDLKRELSSAYGVLSPDGVALRGLFLIDPEGVVQHATVNNLAFGRSVDETLRTLQAIQHVQSHPDEVCPAGWKPGERTLNPAKANEYFSAI